MSRSNRFFAAFISVGLTCSLLFGCSGPAGKTESEPTPVPTNAAELAGYVAEALLDVTSMEYDTETSLRAVMSLGDMVDPGEDPETAGGSETAGDSEAAGDAAAGVEMTAKVHMTSQASGNPEAAHTSGTVDVSVFGESYSEEIESYVVSRDGGYVVYMHSGDDAWIRSETGDIGENDLFNRSIFDAVKDGRVRADLAPEQVNLDGKDVYRIDIELVGDEILEYIGSTLDELKSIFGEHYGDALSQAVLPITFYIDPESNRPIRMEFDAAGIGSQIMSYVHSYISVTVSEFTVSADYRGYNEIPAVTVPEDVIAKAIPSESGSLLPDTGLSDSGADGDM